MKEDHEQGKCHCCGEETMVRWKNIFHMGSEGLWVCQPCENKIVAFVRKLCMETHLKRKEAYIKAKVVR